MSKELNKASVEQAEPASCQGNNCGTTTGDHSSECLAEAAASQGWELKPGDLCGRDCPMRPAPAEQAGGDERDLQGAQGGRDGWGPFPIVQVPWNVFDRAVMWVEDRRRYGDDGTIVDDWKALKTIQRAALAQPSPAQAEQAEAERPELWAVHAQGPDELYAAFSREDAEKHAAELNALPMPEGIAVGAVVVPSPWPAVQHWQYLAEQEQDHKNEIAGRLRQLERICEGLPQDAIDGGWTVQGIRGYAKRLEDQLKAALARVAELEKQEPVATVAKVPGEDWNSLDFHRDLQDMQPGTKLYAAPVAQAQHSVPEEFSFEYRHPNGECHTVTVSRDQVINEMPDFLFEALCSKFCNCEPAGETNVVECCCDEYAEEFKLLAAAPAQAQHSVPEGWMLVECGIWTQEQVDEMQKTVARFRNSEFVDDRALAMAVADAGQCKAPEISLAELLAAAPGKEVGHE